MWVNLKGIVRSERRLTQPAVFCTTPFIRYFGKGRTGGVYPQPNWLTVEEHEGISLRWWDQYLGCSDSYKLCAYQTVSQRVSTWNCASVDEGHWSRCPGREAPIFVSLSWHPPQLLACWLPHTGTQQLGITTSELQSHQILLMMEYSSVIFSDLTVAAIRACVGRDQAGRQREVGLQIGKTRILLATGQQCLWVRHLTHLRWPVTDPSLSRLDQESWRGSTENKVCSDISIIFIIIFIHLLIQIL